MSVKVRIPQLWLHNDAWQAHIEGVLRANGVPVTGMNHATPLVSAGEIASEIVGQNVVFEWTPGAVPAPKETSWIKPPAPIGKGPAGISWIKTPK